MAPSDDYYAVLGVARTADAQTLKKAYRTQAKQWHPDVNKASGAEARFKEVARAWEVLSDPRRRQEYDRTGKTATRSNVDAATASFLREFHDAARWMTDLFFDEILPRYIERYLIGRGVWMLRQMLADVENHTMMDILTAPEPSQQSRKRAAMARTITPVVVRAVAYVDLEGKPIFGRSTNHFGVLGAAWGWSGQIELYAGSFLLAKLTDPSRLAAEILPVLAREYVRLVEDLLPQDLRPLRTREEVDAGYRVARLSEGRAKLADQWFAIKPNLGVAAVILLILALLGIILPGFAP